MSKQPRALYLLNFVSMWECFSFYGLRVLLVLYMVQELGFSDSKALAVYAVFITFAELGGVVGGFIADRFLGFRKSLLIGGWIILVGHLILSQADQEILFYVALGVILTGIALFRSNAAAYLGTFYEENDPRRDAGYTLYYSGINLGGFLAAVGCGIAAQELGWGVGFGLAALGLFIGNIILLLGKNILKNSEISKTAQLIEAVSKKVNVKLVGFFILFLIIFYACEEQLGSTLLLFAERHLARETSWGLIPSAWLVTLNPLTIIVVGPILFRLLQKFPLNEVTKIAVSFLLMGGAFLTLFLGIQVSSDTVPLFYAVLSIVMIGVAELFIGPTLFSLASRSAPRAKAGVMMGVLTLGFSMANMTSGLISQGMAAEEGVDTLALYASGFFGLGLLTLCCSVALFSSLYLFKRVRT